MLIKCAGKSIAVNAKRVDNLGKIIGLMFKFKNTENLLFEFDNDVSISIHSFFVFFPFFAVWLDSDNQVLEYRIVRPFSFYIKPDKKFRKLLEMPINKENNKYMKIFDGRGKI